MKKPASSKTTAHLFPDQKFEAATTQTTINCHVIAPLYYYPLKGREDLLSRIPKKDSDSYRFCIELPQEASETWRLFPRCVA